MEAVAEISRSVEATDVTLKGGCSFAQRFADTDFILVRVPDKATQLLRHWIMFMVIIKCKL